MNTRIVFVLTTLAAFAINSNAFAQRNSNQLDFKRKSSSSYQVQLAEFESASPVAEGLFQQTNPSYTRTYVNQNEVLLEVRALMNAKADRFLAVFNLVQVGETAKNTDELINQRIESYKTDVRTLGIKNNDMYVDMIYLIPTFEFQVEKKLFSKTLNEVPSGFEMQKNVHISFDNPNIVDQLVTLAAKNEIYDLVKLDLFVNDTEGMYDTLRQQSVVHLNKKKADLEKLNVKLSDSYRVIRESSRAIYPDTQYADYEAFVSQSIQAAQKNMGVTTIRKPTTVAYDQIPYNAYDIVINPAILQPVVQYMYTLQVKYTLEPPEKPSKNIYNLVTPNGDVRQLDVK